MSFKRKTFDVFGLFDIELDRKGKNLFVQRGYRIIMRMPADKIWYEPQAVVLKRYHKKKTDEKIYCA